MKIYRRIRMEGNSECIKILGITVYKKYEKNNYITKKLLYGLCKTKKGADYKKYYLCGIKLYKKRLKNNLKPANKTNNYNNIFIMEYFVRQQQLKYKDNPLNIKELLENSKSVMISASQNYLDKAHGYIKYFFKGEFHPVDSLPHDNKSADLFVLLGGIGASPAQIEVVVEAMRADKPCIIQENTFLSSINTFCEQNEPPKYRYNHGCVFDYLTAYYDSTKPSLLENMLNDKNLIIDEEQKLRARKCIDKIVANHLTKYNCQPIYTPKIGRENVKKILVVDQSFGDGSITKGCCSADTFNKMLQAAIDENPDADIIVKTHPDSNTGARTGYYTDLKEGNNIYLFKEPVNPISLVQYCDKVYVCTTQLGFEALMCKKEVHVFGMPFYAGWGLTIDTQKCERRINTRSLEEMFYITYILYSYYIDPNTKKMCEIEQTMENLLKLREEYFKLH